MSSSETLKPISLNERIGILDAMRGLAICGILIGNMQWFSGYGFMPESLFAQLPTADHVTRFLVHFFVEGKFYSIFSFLFGFGFALQMSKAEERGDTKASVFKRRLFWLLVIGLLHAYFLWYGDILSIYALVGLVLLLFRKKETSSLLKWAAIMIAIPIVTYLILYILFTMLAPPGVSAEIAAAQGGIWQNSIARLTNASYWQMVSGHNIEMLLGGRYPSLIVQMRLPKILAMFLLGFYAYKRGVFQDLEGNESFIRRVMIWGLTIGILANIVFAAVSRSEADLPPTLPGLLGVIMYSFGVPAFALGMIALGATLWQGAGQKLLNLAAPVGRMALTNYILQTVICIFIFYGFGLGWFGKLGPFKATLLALGIFASQIIVSAVWLKIFAYGPLEWIWRQLTYKKRLKLRRINEDSVP